MFLVNSFSNPEHLDLQKRSALSKGFDVALEFPGKTSARAGPETL